MRMTVALAPHGLPGAIVAITPAFAAAAEARAGRC